MGWVLLLAFASGFPFGIIQELIPLYLRSEGLGLEAIGLASLIGLPWSLKALWAPLVDRVGSLKSWMILGLAVCTLGTLMVPWVPVESRLLMGILFGIAIGSATQDIAVDGTLATALPADEVARANGLRVGAYRAAMALTGGAAAILGDRLGWPLAFGTMAGVQALLMLGQGRCSLRGGALQREPLGEWIKALSTWAAEPAAWGLFAMALFFKLGDAAMAPMVKTFWLDYGMSVTETAVFSTTFGAFLTVIGAIFGGDLMSRLGPRLGILLLGGAQALSNLGYALAAQGGGVPAIYGASAVESFSGGMGTAALLGSFALAARGSQAATRFAILTAIVGFTRSLAGALSGSAVEQWGYTGWFFLTFLLSLPGLILAIWAGGRLLSPTKT